MGSGASRKYAAAESGDDGEAVEDDDDGAKPLVSARAPGADVAAAAAACGASAPTPVEGWTEDVLQALSSSRLGRRRALCSDKALWIAASTAILEEFPAGGTLEGGGVWDHGYRLVLSGEAAVEMCGGAVVAALRKGDIFGWPAGRLQMEDVDVIEAWNRCNMRILVSPDSALQVARLAAVEDLAPVGPGMPSSRRLSVVGDPSSQGFSSRRGSKNSQLPQVGPSSPFFSSPSSYTANGAQPRPRDSSHSRLLHPGSAGDLGGDRMGLADRLGGLWWLCSPSPGGVAAVTTPLPRVHFQAALWAPLCERLDELKDQIRKRRANGYRIHDCFPLAGYQIEQLKEEVMHLTSVWYGADRGGNLSAMYRWFCEAMEQLGVTAYNFEDIPQERSKDGWVTVVDGQARRNALLSKGTSDDHYVSTGGVVQRQGRSAIDNTVLRNVFLPHEGRELLLGRKLRKVLCKLMQLRQRCLARRIGEHFDIDLLWLAEAGSAAKGHRVVRTALECVSDEQWHAIGVDPNNTCFEALRDRGSIFAGYGQLNAEHQTLVWGSVRDMLARRWPEDHGKGPPSADSPCVFERFVASCRDRPGEFFEGCKHRHTLAHISGIWAGKIMIVRRSVMERLTLARYFGIPWQRCCPLWGHLACGPVTLRKAGAREASNVRANEMPYASLHGMSVSAGGFANDSRDGGDSSPSLTRKYTVAMELQWVQDPKANIENWNLTDIEKIVQEAFHLNPHGPSTTTLSGEAFFNVGQNPKVGSSIKQTQHTQICQGAAASYPILQVPPRAKHRIADGRGIVEIVDLGPEGATQDLCGLMVRVVTHTPADPAVLTLLVDLRYHLLSGIDGAGESVDFLVTAMSTQDGCFVIVFAPLAQLVQVDTSVSPDFSSWVNPLTAESSQIVGLEEARIDFGKGVGHFLCARPELRAQLLSEGEDTMRRVYAFNRVPGARELVDAFLLSADNVFGDDRTS